MNKKKILILIPSLVGGGAEKTLINLLKRIDYSQYEIDLVVVSYNGVYIDQVPEEVKVIPLFRNNFFVRCLAYLQKKIGFDYLFKTKMSRITKHYDTAVSFLDGNFTDLLFFLKNVDKKVSWVHSSYASYSNFAKFYKNESYKQKLITHRYSKLDTIVFVSEDAKREFISIFGEYKDMPVVYNIIDTDSVKEKAVKLNIDHPHKPFFVSIGSLLPVKGYEKLIAAASLVKKKDYDFQLSILGSGYLKEKLQKLIEDNNIEDTVKLLGFQGNPYPYLKRADVFVMSSVSEALPTVLCEAMILEKPTLVTNCSGCRELIDYGNYGVMVEQDIEDIANGIISYIEDKTLIPFYSEKSKERALLFDDTKVLQSYYNIFGKN